MNGIGEECERYFMLFFFCRWGGCPEDMNYRRDSGHVNNGFNANEEFTGSVLFDTQHYDEIDLGVKVRPVKRL